ncbi:heavy metal-binding domain-containing protein [Paraflavitalea speifideaquila]|uniref:heavy metal-binding domain-containing protein n=1 Tax=Paraflavitalea speifideaquila TaxID=3076558 RepID=UPI0033130176
MSQYCAILSWSHPTTPPIFVKRYSHEKIHAPFPYPLLSLTAVLPSTAQQPKAWYCPPCNNSCDSLVFNAPGRCPHCGMELLQQTPEEHRKAMNTKK